MIAHRVSEALLERGDGGLGQHQLPAAQDVVNVDTLHRQNVDVLPVQGINVYDIVRRRKLVLTKAAVEALEARFK